MGRRVGIAWKRLAVVPALLGLLAPAAPAAQRFRLDQRYASIAFTVSNLGLFDSTGQFARFMGELTFDLADPGATSIAVTVAACSVRTPWPQETAMLRSADFFDVVHHKVIRFTSRAVVPDGPGRYTVLGSIELRGVTRPITLAARLMHRSRDPATGTRIEDFNVTGHLDRRDFGMTADPLFIADRVAIDIHARIILDPPHGG